jgi:hypothetical protein
MKIGITGHQKREGIQWPWVRETICAELCRVGNVTQALSSLAAGSDQEFADAAISLGIPVMAVIPLEGYERFFKGLDLLSYQQLLNQCKIVQLRWQGDPEHAFFEAGKFIADQCDVLFAVWDGEKAEGLGGTGDIVDYARQNKRPIIHIEPFSMTVEYI